MAINKLRLGPGTLLAEQEASLDSYVQGVCLLGPGILTDLTKKKHPGIENHDITL
jgi:hypothetical protein